MNKVILFISVKYVTYFVMIVSISHTTIGCKLTCMLNIILITFIPFSRDLYSVLFYNC